MLKTTTSPVKAFAFCCLLSLFSFNVFAQVGIGTSDPKSTLDVRGVNHNGAVTSADGILVPRVNKLSVNGSQDGQLVYLIQNWDSFKKGFHNWNSTTTSWVPITGAAENSEGWALDGNAGTTPGTGPGQNYLGTRDNKAIVLATQENERMRITNDGRVGIGLNNPDSKLEITSDIPFYDALYVTFDNNENTHAAGSFLNNNETAGTGIIGKGNIGVYGETIAYFSGGWAGKFNGNVKIDGNLTVTGTVTASNFPIPSDRRFKSNIVSLKAENDMLKKVMLLNAKSYNW